MEELWRLASDGAAMNDMKKKTFKKIAENFPLIDNAKQFLERRLAQLTADEELLPEANGEAKAAEPVREPLRKKLKTSDTITPMQTEAPSIPEVPTTPAAPNPAPGKYKTVNGVLYERLGMLLFMRLTEPTAVRFPNQKHRHCGGLRCRVEQT